MKITVAIIKLLCIFNLYHASTVVQLTDDEKSQLVQDVNTLRASKGSSDMTKICWKDEFVEVGLKAANCETVMMSDANGYYIRQQVSGTTMDNDILPNAWNRMNNFADYHNAVLSDCDYGNGCGALKILLTESASQIHCVRNKCGIYFYVYCGFPVTSPLTTGMNAYQQGAACSQCGQDEVCMENLCVTQACMPPTTTTTMTTTTTVKPPAMDDHSHDTDHVVKVSYSAASSSAISCYALVGMVVPVLSITF